jgi:hypothetical protein
VQIMHQTMEYDAHEKEIVAKVSNLKVFVAAP